MTIKQARIYAGISQREVAEEANISTATYTMIENQKYLDHYREKEVFEVAEKMIKKNLSDRKTVLESEINVINKIMGKL